MRPEPVSHSTWLRLSEVYPKARRIAGLRYLSKSDFLPEIPSREAERLRGLALRARGEGPAPILILGVMPRSGTNFLRDLLALHPDVCAEPGRLYEFPLLHSAHGAKAHVDEFLAYFPRNAEVVGRFDGLAMLAGTWLRELQLEARERNLLLKSPHVQNLTLAPLIFPGAKILLCLRDGRDVVDSTIRTFSKRSLTRKTFSQLAWEWNLAANAIVQFGENGSLEHPDMQIVLYEDLVRDPKAALGAVFDHIGLDPARYDAAAGSELPVRGSSRSEANDDSRWLPEERREDFNPIGRWMTWSAGRKARFDAIAGVTLEKAGYDREA